MLLLVIVAACGFDPVFAQTTNNGSILDGVANILSDAMKVASRAWIPIATLAGKFMSNDMVYGSRFHLDNYLWQMRNISKNFANFGILGLLLYEIIQGLMTGKLGIQKTIKNAIVAGIAIQMSWFLVGAVVDISTITTTAVGGFPASFLSTADLSNASDAARYMDTRIEQTIKKGTITLDEKARPTWSEIEVADDETTLKTKNKFMPKYDSIAGPLIFIWASALGIQDMMTIKSWENQDTKSILIAFGLKGLVLVLYIVILLLLLIANIMRVWYLRVFIAISPLIILLTVFDVKKWLWSSTFGTTFSLKNMVSIIFKPTLFVAVMGLILIFVTSIQSMLTSEPSINGTSITQTANGTKVEIEGIASVTTNEKILSDIGGTAQNIIPNLLVYFATIFLLRLLVKLSLGSGGDPIAWVMKKGTEFMEKAAMNTQIMNGMSLNSMGKLSSGMMSQSVNGLASGVFGEGTTFNGWSFKNQKFEDAMDEIKWTKKWWSNNDFSQLEAIATDGWDFLGSTNSRIIQNRSWITSDSVIYEKWKWHFSTRLEKTNAKDKNKYGIKASKIDELKADDWKIIHEQLGWDPKKAPIDEDAFKKIEYSGKTEAAK